MPASGRDRGVGPYEVEMVRRVAERAPLAFNVFLFCLVLNTIFETLHFPERRGWMGAFAEGFVLLVVFAWALVRRRSAWAVYVLLGFVNVVGIALNVYHLIVGASFAMALWSLTGLLTASAVILPWGSRNQALASVGVLGSYPLLLAEGTADLLTWGAGGVYLLLVARLGAFAEGLVEARFSGAPDQETRGADNARRTRIGTNRMGRLRDAGMTLYGTARIGTRQRERWDTAARGAWPKTVQKMNCAPRVKVSRGLATAPVV